jgi:hypothetical protein
VHALDTRLSNNSIDGCSQGGIVALGFVPSGSSLEIHGNVVRTNGAGIVVGTGRTSVTANSISGIDQKASGNGIILATGMDKTGLDQCQVIGNRVVAIGGIGISVEVVLKSAMIKNNFIEGAAFGGIVMGEKSSASSISVENNQISSIVPRAGSDQTSVIGIRLVDAKQGGVVGNVISGVGLQAANNRCVGIQLIASGSVRVAGNQVVDIGPVQGNAQTSAGIEAIGTFDQLALVENNVRRSTSGGQVDNAEWHAVLISGAQTPPPGLKGIHAFYAVKTNMSFLLFADHVLARPVRAETVLLQGNFLHTYGIGSAVRAVLRGRCTFNDNRSLLDGRDQPAVDIVAGAAVLNANHVQGTQGEKTIVVKLPDQGPFTVLGNITNRSIEINGAVLGAPWAPLNVQAP